MRALSPYDEPMEEGEVTSMQMNVMLTDGAPLPAHAKPGDAGLDLTSRRTETILPGETVMIHTGLYAEIPDGFCGLVLPRSGVASKLGLAPINSPGLIDSGYRGEILVPLHNYNQAAKIVEEDFDGTMVWSVEANFEAAREVKEGERIAQLVIVPHETVDCLQVNKLDDTDRGNTGFGSSGR